MTLMPKKKQLFTLCYDILFRVNNYLKIYLVYKIGIERLFNFNNLSI